MVMSLGYVNIKKCEPERALRNVKFGPKFSVPRDLFLPKYLAKMVKNLKGKLPAL